MKVYIVFGQRHERYEGEFGPEALAAVDEFAHDENPEWLREQVRKHRNDATTFAAVRAMVVEVDQAQVRRMLIDMPMLATPGVGPTLEGG